MTPAVILILGKRGSGKSALAYRLLELYRMQLSPYVIGVPAQARKLLPDWIGIASSLEDLPPKSVALIDDIVTGCVCSRWPIFQVLDFSAQLRGGLLEVPVIPSH